jgi:hypothetical protein
MWKRVIEWVGLDSPYDDELQDALERAVAAQVALEIEQDLHRKTKLDLAVQLREVTGRLHDAQQEVAALRRLNLAYELVVPAEGRARMDAVVREVEGVFEAFRDERGAA